MTDELKTTALHAVHHSLGAKMVPYAGYEMPVQYAPGVMKEHLHCRAKAGLFDVSHMGQVLVHGVDAARALETLMPVDALGLPKGRQRYGLLLNAQGGIEDDVMFANRGDHMFVVVNAARTGHDLALLRGGLEPLGVRVEHVQDRALLALQGPAAEPALAAICPDVVDMRFLDVATLSLAGAMCWVSRSGYTGEDGFEISVPDAMAEDLARALLADDRVLPIGLGARDSLRLEAGLCLYGHDIDSGVTPVEAGLSWAIQKPRRSGGARAGGFPGAETVLHQLDTGAPRRRVGLRPVGRALMREGVALFDTAEGGAPVGRVTSGGFGPSLGAPLAMGYVPTALAEPGTPLWGEVRGKRLEVITTPLPFVPATVKR